MRKGRRGEMAERERKTYVAPVKADDDAAFLGRRHAGR